MTEAIERLKEFIGRRLQEPASVDIARWRQAVVEDLKLKGSMQAATFSIGEHVAAGMVFAETQQEADARAQRLVTGWNVLASPEAPYFIGYKHGVAVGQEALAEKQRARIGDAENTGALLSIIESLKVGSCWCGMSIGHPAMSFHSDACKAAAKALGQELQP